MTAVRTALVAGGGIVGLVAAAALAQRGIAVTLIERKPEIADNGGIGMGLQSNALAALAQLGIAEACVAAGVAVDHMEIYAPSGELVATRPIPRNGGPDWPGFVGISRPVLHHILAAAAERSGARLLPSAGLATLKDDGDCISVQLEDGRILRADLLVAADGVNSPVRRLLFPEHPEPFATGEGVWRARIASGAALPGVALIFGGAVGTVGHTPITDGEGYLYAVDRSERAPARDEADLGLRFRQLLAGYGGFPARLLERLTDEIHYGPLKGVLLPQPWYRGRAVLIGDAAHAGPPTLAQGAAMGIEDAVVLAECLDSDASIEHALDTWMQRRYERVRIVLEASLVLARAQMREDGGMEIAEAQKRAAEALAQPF